MRAEHAAAGRALPFFVYGTLRRRQGNYRRLAGRTAAEHPAVLPGHAMYVGAGLPWVVAAEREASVVGELMVATTGEYREVLADLDRLEGFRGSAAESNLYERVVRQVTFVDEGGSLATTTTAWVYIAGGHFSGGFRGRDAVRIEGGDWVQFVEGEGSWKRRCAVSAE
jgi:gamma-glutamylcyclotransferase (GGCT)/AIG2-like uncharacterized protein YtfP